MIDKAPRGTPRVSHRGRAKHTAKFEKRAATRFTSLSEGRGVMRILSFPFQFDSEEPIPNEPITDAQFALTNAITRTLRAWIADHPDVTAADLKRALEIAADCIVDRQSEEGGA